MNSQGVRRCVEEKEMYASKYGDLLTNCRKLEEECSLYEHDLDRIMEPCDELGKENEELRSRLQDASNVSVESCVLSFFRANSLTLRVVITFIRPVI